MSTNNCPENWGKIRVKCRSESCSGQKIAGITHGETKEFTKAQAKWIGAVLGILVTTPADLAEKAIRFSDDSCE